MINEYNSTQEFESIAPISARMCKIHDMPLQFVCCQCKIQALLCSECLPDHRLHSWQTLASIQREVQIIGKDQSLSLDRLNIAEYDIKNLLQKFKKQINRKAHEMQQKIFRKLESLKSACDFLSQKQHQINEANVQKILKIIKNHKNSSQNSIDNLRKFVIDSVTALEEKLIGMFSDVELSIDIDWLKTSSKEGKKRISNLKHHLNEPILSDISSLQVQFDQTFKHPSLQLSEGAKKVTYINNSIKGPAALLNCRVKERQTYVFQIVKLTNTAFFFPDTTIFLGVCQSNLTKSRGLRRLTQSGKGAYLIGSTGWCYHHSNPNYERKNIVGWQFGEGDKITIQVNIMKGEVAFVKEGFFFTSQFKMPLNLQLHEIEQLRACVSFQADSGAVVELIN